MPISKVQWYTQNLKPIIDQPLDDIQISMYNQKSNYNTSFQHLIYSMRLNQKQQSKKKEKGQQGPLKKKSVLKVKSKSQEKMKDIEPEAKVEPICTSIVGKPWSELQVQIREEILSSLLANNFKAMFPVQEAAIPLLLKNYDLAVEAQTGSGKTLSFLVPLLQKYLALSEPLKQPRNQTDDFSLIRVKYLLISPTRELCQQSYSTLQKLLNKLPDKSRTAAYNRFCYCATGGNELELDLQKINQGVFVLVGTVGRLREIGQHQEQDWLKKVEYLFIDEADRVLKEKGIQELIKSIQRLRRTAMFSATLQGMDQKNFQFFGMRNLAKISLKAIDNNIKPNSQQSAQKPKGYVIPKSLNNTYLVLKDRLEKIHFLINFIQQQIHKSKIIVFLSTCASVDYYSKIVKSYFQQSQAIFGIHGKLKNRRRKRIIEQFLALQSGVLFATDVVSRGIDFQHIHFIVQVDPPEDPDNYIHRIGRTARVNRSGTAILLIEEHEETFIKYLNDKGVGVKLVDTKQFTKCDTSLDRIVQRINSILLSDRDNIEKSKKAFVSYVRAYKQHELKYIFQFKNVDVGMIAHSFFLLRIPRIKEILGKKITTFTQSEVEIESIPWLDKNQRHQYDAKQSVREEMRQERQEKNKPIADIKNIKSRRKKVRRSNQQKEMKELNKLHKQILKSKKLGANMRDMDIQSDDFDEDTQQIEAKIEKKNERS